MLYHLSENGHLKLLSPRVPECAVHIYEDVSTPRVCFSDFIEGCLSALQTLPDKFYVYTPVKNLDDLKVYYPTVDDVRDAKYNHEVWILEDVEVKCIGVIQSENYDWNKQHNSGRGRVTFYHYPYEWLERYE